MFLKEGDLVLEVDEDYVEPRPKPPVMSRDGVIKFGFTENM